MSSRLNRVLKAPDFTQVDKMLKGDDRNTMQGDLFSRAVVEGAEVPTPLMDAVANMAVIDAVRRSSGSGNWESVIAHRA